MRDVRIIFRFILSLNGNKPVIRNKIRVMLGISLHFHLTTYNSPSDSPVVIYLEVEKMSAIRRDRKLKVDEGFSEYFIFYL